MSQLISFEHIRSLPCGHTYCSSCVEKLIDDIDETSTCPECRNDFEFEDIRSLYLKPSNNSSRSQTSSGHDSAGDQDGYIKQAKHIARRLQKLNTKSPAESVKNAADVIEQVATVQCKAAQAYFEKLDEHEDFRAQISCFRQRLDVADNMSSRLRLEVEKERNQGQQYLAVIKDKTREIDKLMVALRTADDEASQERDRQHVLIARLRASEIKRRAQIKQLQMELRSQKEEGLRTQLEEESLIIEPGEAYNKARSHRLDIYEENVSSPKRCKLLPEVSASADGLNDVPSPGESSDHWPSTSATPPTEFRTQPRERVGLTHHQSTARPESDLVSPSPQRPKFGSDWNVSRRFQRRKLTGKSNSATLPFPLDAQGRPKGLLKYGSRVRVKVK
ncbi:hypothetical protein BGY98DRAFT_1092621 [Russula aff. rugulosa BPL654]|nr:hypothetical protein BGY98DRAFT_1092621 [Russula aff. rugulosa BPL654]